MHTQFVLHTHLKLKDNAPPSCFFDLVFGHKEVIAFWSNWWLVDEVVYDECDLC